MFIKLRNSYLRGKKRATGASWPPEVMRLISLFNTSTETRRPSHNDASRRFSPLSWIFHPLVGGIRCLVPFTRSAFCLGAAARWTDKTNLPGQRHLKRLRRWQTWNGRPGVFQPAPRLAAPFDTGFTKDGASWKPKTTHLSYKSGSDCTAAIVSQQMYV